MDIIYISRACSPTKYKEYAEANISQASQKYNCLLAEGLAAQGARVFMLVNRPVNRSIESKKWLPGGSDCENGVDYYYLPVANLPVARNIVTFFSVFNRVLFAKSKKKNTAVVCDALNIFASMGALAASLLRGYKTVGIVTDVPCHFASNKKPSFGQRLNLSVMKKFNSFLFLTEPMSAVVNPKNKPYIVLEGHADISAAKRENTLDGKYEKKVCIYAGSLHKVYGIKNLTDGFLLADIPNSELHIYGSGDYTEELKDIAAKNDSIKYFGIKPNGEVVDAEYKAALLINPRPTDEEFTKYSFPSKNMEYMASGTPLLTTRLPGMPEDHKPYVFFIDDESADGIAAALKSVFSHSDGELHEFGAAAKEYILNNKSNVKQAKRVSEFLAKFF